MSRALQCNQLPGWRGRPGVRDWHFGAIARLRQARRGRRTLRTREPSPRLPLTWPPRPAPAAEGQDVVIAILGLPPDSRPKRAAQRGVLLCLLLLFRVGTAPGMPGWGWGNLCPSNLSRDTVKERKQFARSPAEFYSPAASDSLRRAAGLFAPPEAISSDRQSRGVRAGLKGLPGLSYHG